MWFKTKTASWYLPSAFRKKSSWYFPSKWQICCLFFPYKRKPRYLEVSKLIRNLFLRAMRFVPAYPATVLTVKFKDL